MSILCVIILVAYSLNAHRSFPGIILAVVGSCWLITKEIEGVQSSKGEEIPRNDNDSLLKFEQRYEFQKLNKNVRRLQIISISYL